MPSIIGESPVQRYIASNLDRMVVTLRHPSNGGPVGTSSDDGIRRDPSRLRVVGLKLALCELVGQQTEETVVETFLIYY